MLSVEETTAATVASEHTDTVSVEAVMTKAEFKASRDLLYQQIGEAAYYVQIAQRRAYQNLERLDSMQPRVDEKKAKMLALMDACERLEVEWANSKAQTDSAKLAEFDGLLGQARLAENNRRAAAKKAARLESGKRRALKNAEMLKNREEALAAAAELAKTEKLASENARQQIIMQAISTGDLVPVNETPMAAEVARQKRSNKGVIRVESGAGR